MTACKHQQEYAQISGIQRGKGVKNLSHLSNLPRASKSPHEKRFEQLHNLLQGSFVQNPSALQQGGAHHTHNPLNSQSKNGRIPSFSKAERYVPPSWRLPPTEKRSWEKRSGRLPISKGFTLLSVSHEGKGNATPWVCWVRVVAAQLAF